MAPKKRTIYAVTDHDLESIHDYELATLVNQARYDLTQFIDDEATAANILQEEEKLPNWRGKLPSSKHPPSLPHRRFAHCQKESASSESMSKTLRQSCSV
jgi:hypothetical protein